MSRTRYLPAPSIAPSGGSPRACEAGGGAHRCSSGIRLLRVSPDAMESMMRERDRGAGGCAGGGGPEARLGRRHTEPATPGDTTACLRERTPW